MSEIYPAENAVGFVAEFTVELVDFILVDAPPSTVGSLTVEAVLRAAFRDAQTQLQEPLVLLLREQLHPESYSDESATERYIKSIL